MQTAKTFDLQFNEQADDPIALADIFSPSVSVAIWQRPAISVVSRYFDEVFKDLGAGIRQVFEIRHLREGLLEALPNGQGKSDAAEDIYLLGDMLTCLFNCEAVGLRLAPLRSAMCPKFHTDNIQVRLVNTYLGNGTQWLTQEQFESDKDDNGQNFNQLNSFDVALLKGSAWEGQEDCAAVHRSCPVAVDSKRVLLTLDPM